MSVYDCVGLEGLGDISDRIFSHRLGLDYYCSTNVTYY